MEARRSPAAGAEDTCQSIGAGHRWAMREDLLHQHAIGRRLDRLRPEPRKVAPQIARKPLCWHVGTYKRREPTQRIVALGALHCLRIAAARPRCRIMEQAGLEMRCGCASALALRVFAWSRSRFRRFPPRSGNRSGTRKTPPQPGMADMEGESNYGDCLAEMLSHNRR
jgi:hypothetical protein